MLALVTADIMALAKGIASGLPLGATIASAKIMNWEAGSHASTLGGNPLSCQAAMATIELLEKKDCSCWVVAKTVSGFLLP